MNEIKHEQKHVHLHFPHLFKKNKKKTTLQQGLCLCTRVPTLYPSFRLVLRKSIILTFSAISRLLFWPWKKVSLLERRLQQFQGIFLLLYSAVEMCFHLFSIKSKCPHSLGSLFHFFSLFSCFFAFRYMRLCLLCDCSEKPKPDCQTPAKIPWMLISVRHSSLCLQQVALVSLTRLFS